MQELSGRVAVVTGAASGIGFALARALLAAGSRVVAADVEAPALERAADELASAGEVVPVVCDVSRVEEVERLRAAALDRFGAVHVVCNNAGVFGGGPLAGVSLEKWEWVLGVNLWGVIHGVHAFLPLLQEQDEGHIVNTASIMGLIPSPLSGPYTVSKYGVVALSEVLSLELQRQGSRVGVSVLCPSWVRTNIHDAERNRPERFGGAGAEPLRPDLGERVREAISTRGVEADEVAAQTINAIRRGRFYVLNHDRNDRLVRSRTEAVLSGEAPAFDVLG